MKSKQNNEKEIDYDSRIIETYGKISEVLDSKNENKKPQKKKSRK